MQILFVSAVVLKALLQDHLEGPTPTVSDSAGLDLDPRIYIYNMMVVMLLVQDQQPLGTPGLVESSLLLSREEKVYSHPPPLAFRFCHLVNLALGIYLVSLDSAYFLYQNAPGLSL